MKYEYVTVIEDGKEVVTSIKGNRDTGEITDVKVSIPQGTDYESLSKFVDGGLKNTIYLFSLPSLVKAAAQDFSRIVYDAEARFGKGVSDEI